MKLTRKQTIAIEYLRDRITTELYFGGGAGGGKTALGCYWQLQNRTLFYPGTRGMIGRSGMKSLRETTLQTFFEVAENQGFKLGDHYELRGAGHSETPNCLYFPLKKGDSFIFLKDLKYYPSDPEYTELGSLEITDAFIDECGNVEYKAKDILTSRIRYKIKELDLAPKLLMAGNPVYNWTRSQFYDPWKRGILPEYRQFVQSLARDNPNLSDSYRVQLSRLDPIARARLEDGDWDFMESEGQIFDYGAVSDMFTNTFVPRTGERYITADPAYGGADTFVIAVWDGWVLIDLKEYDKTLSTDVTALIRKTALQYNVPGRRIAFDATGSGEHLRGDLASAIPFVGASMAIKTDKEGTDLQKQAGRKPGFRNLRAQCYFRLAKRIDDCGIFFDTNSVHLQERTRQELLATRQESTKDGDPLLIIPKEKIKEAIGRSPGIADVLSMREVFDLEPYKQRRPRLARAG